MEGLDAAVEEPPRLARRRRRARASIQLRAGVGIGALSLVIALSAGRRWMAPSRPAAVQSDDPAAELESLEADARQQGAIELATARAVAPAPMNTSVSVLRNISILALGNASATNSTAAPVDPRDAHAPAGGGHHHEELTCDSDFVVAYPTIATLALCWGILYMFWALAIVCDDYFVESLQLLSDKLHLSEDVAGATFMAAGSSAPELFTSLMGVFAVHNDVGVGTIVGSAVFNLCCIIGGTALFSPRPLQLDWRPFTRDATFYALSIVVLVVAIHDGRVSEGDAALCVCAYALYVALMAVNPQLMAALGERFGGAADAAAQHLQDGAAALSDEAAADGGKADADADAREEPEAEPGLLAAALKAPIDVLFTLTIPNCAVDKRYYMWCFLASVVWIGALSYLMVAWATTLGCLLHIHPAVMGVTVLAAGTSVPDAIASLLVAAKGHGDMAVSNAIGSNVFDILLGLGLPWAISTIGLHQPVAVDAANLGPMALILFGTLAVIVATVRATRFTLNKAVGVFFFALYVAFCAYVVLQEFGLLR